MKSGALGLALLAACGVVLLIGLVMLDTLTYQLSQQPAFTDLLLQRYPVVQQLLQPLLDLGSAVLPEVASPRAPAELGEWFAPLTAAWVAACAVTALGYLGALWVLSHTVARGRGAVLVIVGFVAVFALTVFMAPGLLSQDVFGYLMYGEIADTHGLNPYIWPPSAFAHDPLLNWVAPIWRSLPSPYGPMWTDVNWALAHVLGDWTIVEQVLAYKVMAAALLIVSLAAMWWLLGRTLPEGVDLSTGRLVAFTAFAWNPLVLVETVGNGHNDALVLALLLVGLVPLAMRPSRFAAVGRVRSLAGFTLVVLSGLVKYLSAIAAVFLLVAWVRRAAGPRQRLQVLIAVSAFGVLLTAALFGPWLELPDSLDPILRQTGGDLYANAVPDLVSLTVSDQYLYVSGVPLADAREAARLGMKRLVDLVFLLYLLWETREVWRSAAGGQMDALRAVITASTRASLVVIMVVSIWVQPWYFVLPLGLGVLLGASGTLTRVVIGYTLAAFTALYVHYYLQDAASGLMYLAYAGLPLLVPLAVVVKRRLGDALGRRDDLTRLAVRLVDESGQALIADAARSAAVAEVDRGATNDGAAN